MFWRFAFSYKNNSFLFPHLQPFPWHSLVLALEFINKDKKKLERKILIISVKLKELQNGVVNSCMGENKILLNPEHL